MFEALMVDSLIGLVARLTVKCRAFKKHFETSQNNGTASKPMTNERLCVHGFQLAQLVWPPVVLRDGSWLMAWSEQVIHREFNALSGGKKPLMNSFLRLSASGHSLSFPGM